MKEAGYYEKRDGGRVVCVLCPHNCHLADGGVGVCQARKNHGGTLYSLNYGQISSLALDPIEKKPIKMFKAGSSVLSAGSFGCNFRCGYCQNWSISQEHPGTRKVLPEELVDLARKYAHSNPHCIGLAYTYSEPAIWYEYVLDCARLAKKAGMDNILVTNGYIEPEPLRELLPHIDAINLDIKSYTEDFYRQLCGGSLHRVLANAKVMAESCHLEVTTLLVPGYNDDPKEIAQLAKFIAGIDSGIPLHLTRYFPNYKMELPPTARETMQTAYDAASKFLRHVFLGNI